MSESTVLEVVAARLQADADKQSGHHPCHIADVVATELARAATAIRAADFEQPHTLRPVLDKLSKLYQWALGHMYAELAQATIAVLYAAVRAVGALTNAAEHLRTARQIATATDTAAPAAA